jgi:hypothetical protein
VDLLLGIRANGSALNAHVLVVGLGLIVSVALRQVVLGFELIARFALGEQPRHLGIADLTLQSQ